MGSDVFDKCADERFDGGRALERDGALPFFNEFSGPQLPETMYRGKAVVMLGSNNYLGLTSDQRVQAAAIVAVEEYGTGCTGSRLMNGSLPLHRELEETLLEWVGGEACLVFTTGYAVNLGVISALVGENDRVFLDAEAHASLLDGARLAPGSWTPFRHNGADVLRHRLQTWRARGGGGALVAIDAIYSMMGDAAPVADIASVCADEGARLMVDEAHSIGVIGPRGAGLSAAQAFAPDLVMGTFSKALASCGGFVTGPRDVIDYLRIACRPFLFTAAGVPAALGAALAATRIASEEEWRREALRARAAQLQEGLRALGYDTGPDTPSAIVPIRVGTEQDAFDLWLRLMQAGVYTNCAVSPAVAPGKAVLRTSVMATHEEAHITRALDAFASVTR